MSQADILERDRQIIERIGQAGETGVAAVAELYDAYGRLVFSLIVKMVGDSAVAEELVQDVFVRAWRSALTYQPALGSVRTWLLAIAHHRAVDELRHRRKERGWISLDHANADGLATVEDAATDPLVSRAMHSLSAEQRQVIELAYFHGLPGPEIAARLNLPLGTVKSLARLALERLRAALGIDKDEPR
jgi:RNA polymerase sigma-70 factor, ECF subfamily